jgi:dynein intermediate chain
MSDESDEEPVRGGMGRETEEEMRRRILDEMDQARVIQPEEVKMESVDLSNEQKQAIYAAPAFTAFIEESTRIVQRALSDNYDYIKDYTIGMDGVT